MCDPIERLIPLKNPGLLVEPIGTLEADRPPLFVSKRAFLSATRHASTSTTSVTAGFFTGGHYYWEDVTFITIESFHAARRGHSLPEGYQFTPECWDAFSEDLETSLAANPNLQPAGWMLGLPSTGLTMSAGAFALHRSHFPQPWMVHLVVDPVQGQTAWFRRHGDSMEDTGFLLYKPRT